MIGLKIFQSYVSGRDSLRNTNLNCVETHGNSLRESSILLITCNLNNYRVLYRFSNKSYNENKTNFEENSTELVADAIIFVSIRTVSAPSYQENIAADLELTLCSLLLCIRLIINDKYHLFFFLCLDSTSEAKLEEDQSSKETPTIDFV